MRRFRWIPVIFCVLSLTAGLVLAQETAQSSSAVLTATPTPTPTISYDPTLYAIRHVREMEIAASLGPTEHAVFMQTERALIATYAGTVVPSPTAEFTAVPYNGCAWAWHTEILPDLSNYVRIALRLVPELRPYHSAGYAEAFGENCFDAENDVVRFAIMETDFHVSLWADDLTLPDESDDLEAYGEILRNVLIALSTFDNDMKPGPQAGYIAIEFWRGFGTGETELVHTVNFGDYDVAMDALATLLDDDLHGEAVITILTDIFQ